MSRIVRPALVSLLFLACTFYFLQPFSTSPGAVVREYLDCLLNASTMYRIQEHIANGEWSELYEGHYFYPRKEVLTYSETILPTAIISWPAMALTGNPIFGHNFILLLNVFLAALFTYILARQLTGSTTAAIVAGILNAYWIQMLGNMSALQTITTYWLPLTMICLHKYWGRPRARYVVAAAVLYTIQTLSCVYLGLIYSFAIFLTFVFITLSHYRQDRRGEWPQAPPDSPTATRPGRSKYFAIPLFLLIFGALVAWPVAPYFELIDKLAKQRRPVGLLTKLNLPFPNEVCFGLIIAGWLLLLWQSRRRATEGADGTKAPKPRLLWWVVAANRASFVVMLAGFAINRYDVQIFSGQAGPIPLAYPICVFLVTGLLAMSVRKLTLGRFTPRLPDVEALYLAMALVAYFLAFGDSIIISGRNYGMGLFSLLARAVEPFAALRLPGRFWFLFTFGFWMLVAFAVKRIEAFLAEKSLLKTTYVFRGAAIACALFTVYPELPLDHRPALTRENMPACYKWLARQDGRFVILDVPSIWDEAIYQYYGLFHNKKIVNGYSRYFPPENDVVKRVFSGREISRWPGEVLNEIGVKYLVLHLNELGGPPVFGIGEDSAADEHTRIEIVRRFGDCWLLQTKQAMANQPIGPLFESRSLVFRASIGPTTQPSKGIFEDQASVARYETSNSTLSDVEVSFDQPTRLEGVMLNLDPATGQQSIELEVYAEDEEGSLEALTPIGHPALDEYRRALHGESLAGLYEFTFPTTATKHITVRLGEPPQGNEVEVLGFVFKKAAP